MTRLRLKITRTVLHYTSISFMNGKTLVLRSKDINKLKMHVSTLLKFQKCQKDTQDLVA